MQHLDTHGDRKRAAILDQGVALWRSGQTVTASAIGRALGMRHTGVLYHYGNAGALRDAVAAHAVAIGDPVVVPMLITTKHPAIAKLPDADRVRYLAAVG